MVFLFMFFFFFFQAEDGIRDKLVTGVQTCALPILGFCSGRTLLLHCCSFEECSLTLSVAWADLVAEVCRVNERPAHDTCFLFRWANSPVCACTSKDDKEGSYFRRCLGVRVSGQDQRLGSRAGNCPLKRQPIHTPLY